MIRILALILLASPAGAQSNCAPRELVAAGLADQWGEARRSIALDAAGSVVEIWASTETRTWTMTVTVPGGPTCIVASGIEYQPVKEPILGGAT